MDTLRRIHAIAQQSMTEAWYSRLYLLIAVTVLICIGLGAFARALVLTGGSTTGLIIYNFSLRVAFVAIFAIHVSQALQRDRIDKQTEVLLSLDMPRMAYLLGRTVGFLGILAVCVLLATVFPLWQVNPIVGTGWAVSLYAELGILVCISVFVSTSIRNPAGSFIIILSVYLLARNIGNLLLLSQSPILDQANVGIEGMQLMLETLNLLLPDLWRFASSEWLASNSIDTNTVLMNVLSGVIFGILLLMAAGIDLYRQKIGL